MYIKKLKRKCGVRGCKNTETYSLSNTREMGNSVIICKDCLASALAVIEPPIEELPPLSEEAPAEAVTEEAPAVIEAPADKPKRQRKA